MNPTVETTRNNRKDAIYGVSVAMNNAIDALEQKRFFKLVCGASLTDVKMIENLVFVFTLAGAHVIDLAPAADVIFAARRGIEKAIDSCRRDIACNVSTAPPLIMASIQLDKDPHFRKVAVDYDLCDLCGACIKACPTEAFKIEKKEKFIYSIERCYGCGICPQSCHVNALQMVETSPTPIDTLKEMLLLGIEAIEFHFGENFQKLEEVWKDISTTVGACCSKPLLSFSIGGGLLSEEQIKKSANLCYKLAGKGIILQCDGVPMSGARKQIGNNNDEAFIRVAKTIAQENLPVYLQIAGGTNENSFSKTHLAGINIHGVAIGSYAKKLLMPFINDLDKKENLIEAVNIASSLVNSVYISSKDGGG